MCCEAWLIIAQSLVNKLSASIDVYPWFLSTFHDQMTKTTLLSMVSLLGFPDFTDLINMNFDLNLDQIDFGYDVDDLTSLASIDWNCTRICNPHVDGPAAPLMNCGAAIAQAKKFKLEIPTTPPITTSPSSAISSHFGQITLMFLMLLSLLVVTCV